jgi:hypothetical protein
VPDLFHIRKLLSNIDGDIIWRQDPEQGLELELHFVFNPDPGPRKLYNFAQRHKNTLNLPKLILGKSLSVYEPVKKNLVVANYITPHVPLNSPDNVLWLSQPTQRVGAISWRKLEGAANADHRLNPKEAITASSSDLNPTCKFTLHFQFPSGPAGVNTRIYYAKEWFQEL